MGYMGFGMQSWVYKMRPRKPFSMERKMSFDPLTKYSRQFKIQPSVNKNVRLKNLLLVLSILIMIPLLFNISMGFVDYNRNHYRLMGKRIQNENKEAFDFLIDSGKYRLSINNFIGAQSEFKLAVKIYPENKEAYQLLIETTSILCDNDNKYCDELVLLMDSELSSE